MCREFDKQAASLVQQRSNFKTAWKSEDHKGKFQCPEELEELQFHEWFTKEIRARNTRGEDVADELQAIANACPKTPFSYKGFTTANQLFRTKEVDASNYTNNSIILREFLMHHESGEEYYEDFVGYIDQILELDFLYFKKVIVMCTWFGGAQQRSRTSIKIDEYGFTLFDTSKHISKSTAYGNPCVEPSKIRQAFTCPVDNDSN